MDDYFTICQYKTEEPRNIEISAPISLGFVLVWNKHVSPRSKITVFQTYNKKYGIIKCSHMSWDTSTSQIHHRGNHLTLSEHKNENFQSIEKHRENKYACSFSFTKTFLLVLVAEYDGGVSWKIGPATREESKYIFVSYT